MTHYLLSVHTSDAPVKPDSSSEDGPPDLRALMGIEADMQAGDTWVFSGGLTSPSDATVLRRDSGRLVTTDGPYAEAKEHLAGFYVIRADDLEEALDWADRVTTCVGAPIEVRPFAATGDLESQMGATG